MATTQTQTPTCLVDQIGSNVTIGAAVRFMALLWTLPASLLTIAGYRYVFDRPPAPLVASYVDLSRALVPLLTAFTLLVGGIWLVRSGRLAAGLGDPSRPTLAPAGLPLSLTSHFELLALSIVALGIAVTATGATVSTAAASVAASVGFLGGLVLPRWLWSMSDNDDGVMSGWALLSAVMVFELTLGWLHSMMVVDGASVLSGWFTLARGILMSMAVAAAALGSQTTD